MNAAGGGVFLGNARLVARLRSKLARERLPHAMIFSGPEGIGKRTLALRVAQALNCGARDAHGRECGSCGSCRAVPAGSHPDVSTVSVEPGSTRIRIEQIRELRARLELAVAPGSAQVFLIDPAERMNPASANAVLKVLEEPPDRTYFVLITTNLHELMPTIRSRCQVYRFLPLGLDELREAGPDDELVLRWARGSVGRALATDPVQLRTLRDAVLAFLESAVDADGATWPELFAESADLARSRDEYGEKLRAVGVVVADILYAGHGLEDRIVNVDVRERIRKLASRLDPPALVRIADCIRFIERALKSYVNRQMLTDALALTLNTETAPMFEERGWSGG